MACMNLYRAMFRRKSVRRYHMHPLSTKVLTELNDYASGLEPLFEDITVKFTFAKHGEVRNLLPVRAPHYVLISSEKKDNYLYNVGFMGQQIDLFLSANGLGSCWMGAAKPRPGQIVKQPGNLDFVIMLGFGKPAEPLHRTDVSQFRRKPMSQISSVKDGERLLEPVRLAPSAVNRQPWCFYGTTSEVHIGRTKLNPLTSTLYDRLNQIDTGIALCHLVLSAQHMGRPVCFRFAGPRETEPPKGYQYVITANIT
ncbi:MAG TPA: nitroreductase [Firmicutes bacterium]|nr:nitroreductase [Candidatus Fermentithermobacillaceae bacterium]